MDKKNKKMRVLDGKGILPSSFVKHSNSRTTINNAIAANPPAYAQARVNKRGQTLTERFGSHEKTRYEAPVQTRFMKDNFPEAEVLIKSRSFSVSMEEKNLIYLDRAIDYLRQAPDAECAKVLSQMGAFEFEKGPPGPDNLQPVERDWGPHPDKLDARGKALEDTTSEPGPSNANMEANNAQEDDPVYRVAMEPRATERRPALASLLMKVSKDSTINERTRWESRTKWNYVKSHEHQC